MSNIDAKKAREIALDAHNDYVDVQLLLDCTLKHIEYNAKSGLFRVNIDIDAIREHDNFKSYVKHVGDIPHVNLTGNSRYFPKTLDFVFNALRVSLEKKDFNVEFEEEYLHIKKITITY